MVSRIAASVGSVCLLVSAAVGVAHAQNGAPAEPPAFIAPGVEGHLQALWLENEEGERAILDGSQGSIALDFRSGLSRFGSSRFGYLTAASYVPLRLDRQRVNSENSDVGKFENVGTSVSGDLAYLLATLVYDMSGQRHNIRDVDFGYAGLGVGIAWARFDGTAKFAERPQDVEAAESEKVSFEGTQPIVSVFAEFINRSPDLRIGLEIIGILPESKAKSESGLVEIREFSSGRIYVTIPFFLD